MSKKVSERQHNQSNSESATLPWPFPRQSWAEVHVARWSEPSGNTKAQWVYTVRVGVWNSKVWLQALRVRESNGWSETKLVSSVYLEVPQKSEHPPAQLEAAFQSCARALRNKARQDHKRTAPRVFCRICGYRPHGSFLAQLQGGVPGHLEGKVIDHIASRHPAEFLGILEETDRLIAQESTQKRKQ